jgi:hypothetical protein
MRSSQPQVNHRSALRTLWQRAAAVAIGVQFLVPAGYMPGALADGTPFVLCHMYAGAPGPQEHGAAATHAAHAAAAHSGHAASSLADVSPHDSADGHAAGTGHEDHSDADVWENCPLGALSSGAPLAAAAVNVPALPMHERIATTLTARRGIVTPIILRARAPPALSFRAVA